MEWLNKILANSKKNELHQDENIRAKLEIIDIQLKEDLLEYIEKDRLREQRTLEISRQYFLG